ncbi:MAG TPA: hypothetical protein VFA09_06605 [Ktedonobacteraceae bacterium]|nr:hypothetical protein [Ktedonobacteraceae bacterium]
MSEYQRYEFMTIDRPLTREQLDAINGLSSHIKASPTHAFIEYHWGDFKHDPIQVLYEFFDAFLYWANWGSPQLAFRFPHGVLPANLLEGYNLEDFVTFTRHADYDILDIEFGELEAPDVWAEYELGSLIPIRDELMEGDLRPLYIIWLAAQNMMKGYARNRYSYSRNNDNDGYEEDEDEEWDEDQEDEDDESEDEDQEEDEDHEISIPAVPPAFDKLTAAQQALAELFRVPEELLTAVAGHSKASMARAKDDFAAWIRLLSPERQHDYLVRLAHNEPGLSRQLVRELRELGHDKTTDATPTGERVPFAILLAESKEIKDRAEREKREQERAARLRHLQDIHKYRDTYWRKVDQGAASKTSAGYDEATTLLVDLRDAAEQFNTTQEFQDRFNTWIRAYLSRPALIRRLKERHFSWPGG